MSTGQLYVVWSTLCRLVKFYMSFGQLYVVWSSFICLLVNLMSSGQVLYVYWSTSIYDLGRQTSPSQYELGSSGSSEARKLRLQRYVSRMTRTENLLSQNFSKFFWKLLLFMFHATLIIMSRKYFFRFSKVTYASIHDFGLEGSPCNAISEGRPSLRNTSSEAPEARKLRLQRYVSRMYLQSELTEGCKFD